MSQPAQAASRIHLERLYLQWRERSVLRWHSQIGDDAGDLLSDVWLRLSRAESFAYSSDMATLRYIETVAEYVLRDRRRQAARRAELMSTAIELGARGLTSQVTQVSLPVLPPVDISEAIDAAGLTKQQRIVIVGLRRGVDRETLAEQMGVSMETVREHERAAIGRLRDVVKEEGR